MRNQVLRNTRATGRPPENVEFRRKYAIRAIKLNYTRGLISEETMLRQLSKYEKD